MLKDQLMREIPGIINWALEGLRDLNQTDKFIVPKISEVAKKELQYMTSPMAAMGDQCLCFDDVNACTTNTQLFDLHREWFKENGYSMYNCVWFGRVFITTFPNLKKCKMGINEKQVRGYRGVSILSEAAERYLGSPK